MSNSRIKNSARNMIFGMLKYVVSIIFPFIIRTIIIYKLGTEYAGISSLFTSILQVLNLSELGFSTAVVFTLYEPVAKQETERICSLLYFFKNVYRFCGLFILTAGVCVCPFIKHLISGSYPETINIYVIFILLLVNTSCSYLFCGYKSVLFIANQRDDVTSKTQIMANLIMYISQIIALYGFSNYYLYVICMIAGTLLNNLLMYIFSKKMFPGISCRGKIKKEESKKLISNVGSLFGHQLDMVIITSADNIIISMFLGLTTLTIYNNYYYIVNSILSILIMISNSFAASIGNSIVVESREKNYKNFIYFTYLLGMLNVICTILMFVLYQDFMKIWMGDLMLLNIITVFLMCLCFYTRQFRRTVITYKTATGLWKMDMIKPYLAATLNLVLNIALVRVIGLNGVVISTIVSMVLIEIPWETVVLFKYYFKGGPKEYLEVQIKLILKLIIIGTLTYLLFSRFGTANILTFFMKAIIAGLFVVALFVLMSFKDKEFKYIIGFIKRMSSKVLKKKMGGD